MSDTYLAWVVSINFSCLIVVLFFLFGGNIEPVEFDLKVLINLYEGTIGILPSWFFIAFAGMFIVPIAIKIVCSIYYSIKEKQSIDGVRYAKYV